MKCKVSYFFLRLVLLFGVVSTTTAEMFVYSVNGSPTISMDGYFKDQPIELGMFIHPYMKVQVSHLYYFWAHCGDLGEPVKIVNAKQVSGLCKHKNGPDAMRSDAASNHPIIISPRKSKALTLDRIEWGYSNATSNYNLSISKFGGDGKTLVDVVLSSSKEDSLYNIQFYQLSKKQKSLLKSGQKYKILIKDLSTGRSSERDTGFSGVVQLAAKSEIRKIENNLKKIKQMLGNNSLANYFSAIHMRNNEYYADSNWLLQQADFSVNPIHYQYLQAKNAQSEGVPINYMMKKWIELLVAAVKKNNASTAALACVEIRSNYHKLSKFWLDFVGNYKAHKTFRKYCDLTDL